MLPSAQSFTRGLAMPSKKPTLRNSPDATRRDTQTDRIIAHRMPEKAGYTPLAPAGRSGQLMLAPPLPTAAPELWSSRDLNRREDPTQFVRRVYGPWLGRRLARKDLARLDSALYKALNVWLHRHPDDPLIPLLPSNTDVIDDLIASLSEQYPVDVLRRLGYAIDARMRRNPSAFAASSEDHAETASQGDDPAEFDLTSDLDATLTPDQLRDSLLGFVKTAPADKLGSLATVFRSVVGGSAPTFQKVKPEDTFAARLDRQIPAPHFIREKYGHLLDGNFTRADLRKIDPSAVKGLENYEHQHGQQVPLDELNLPTLKQRNDRLLATLNEEPDSVRRRGLRHLRAQRARKNAV